MEGFKMKELNEIKHCDFGLSCPSTEYEKRSKEINNRITKIINSDLWKEMISEEKDLGNSLTLFVKENFVQYCLSRTYNL